MTPVIADVVIGRGEAFLEGRHHSLRGSTYAAELGLYVCQANASAAAGHHRQAQEVDRFRK
jgi:hypothetical protein